MSDCFRIKIAIKPINQIYKIYKSNYSQDLEIIIYIFINALSNLKLIINNRIIKILENKKICLTYLIFNIKQTIKISKNKKVYIPY